MLCLSLRRIPPYLPPSFLACFQELAVKYYCLPIKHLPCFLPSFLPFLITTRKPKKTSPKSKKHPPKIALHQETMHIICIHFLGHMYRFEKQLAQQQWPNREAKWIDHQQWCSKPPLPSDLARTPEAARKQHNPPQYKQATLYAVVLCSIL